MLRNGLGYSIQDTLQIIQFTGILDLDDNNLSALMIQNDVLDSAKLEGKIEGHMENAVFVK